MTAPGLITISNPQNRVKDSYASSPKIDLTVRANGEEKVMVMDAQGRWTVAGFNSPSVAATLSTTATAGSFTANMYWVYTYVYVAKRNYPLVENAQTGGGSPAPRSNPAPLTTANSTVNTNRKLLDIPTSQRSDISHIWIYRTTTAFDTAAEALTNAQAGVMFWLGEVENNSNLATVPYTDTGADSDGLEQIENDNFPAPIFDKVVYADPYFWGFGNSIWFNWVTVDPTGLITIYNALSPTDIRWYDGRDGQTISINGITSGGYDNHGNFYFKALTNKTAQLYSDIALTLPVGVSYSGISMAYVRGQNTVLYRSKARNPLSWGFTDLIGDEQIPSVYQFPVGGGEGTGIAIIANQNLLKLDTEKPTRCYTLNLKNAGTPNFESSLRIISDAFSVSHHDSQFTAVTDRGQIVLRSLDMKSYCLIDCDGAVQVPISSKVYRTLQIAEFNFSNDEPYKKSDRICAIYVPKWELNCVFIRLYQANSIETTRLIYQHAPTGYWGIIDLFDVICAEAVYDDNISSNRIFVGTNTGLVGELFADNTYKHWFADQTDGTGVLLNIGQGACTMSSTSILTVLSSAPRFTTDVGNSVPMSGLIGNWVTVVYTTGYYYGRVATVTNNGLTLNFDLTFGPLEGVQGEIPIKSAPVAPFAATYYIGLIQMEIGRTFNGQIPFDYKKVEEIHTAWRYRTLSGGQAQTEAPSIEFYGTFLPDNSAGTHATPMIASNNSTGQFPANGNYVMASQIPIDLAKTFGIIIRDRNRSETQLMSYELRLSSTDGNQRQTRS